jgi:hypothetical protein
MGGPGAQQGAGAVIDRRAGGQHVVDQHHPAAGDLGLLLRRHAEGALHVVGVLRLRLARTRFSESCSTGTPHWPEIAPASVADRLKRRPHNLRQCSGTGHSGGSTTSRPERSTARNPPRNCEVRKRVRSWLAETGSFMLQL